MTALAGWESQKKNFEVFHNIKKRSWWKPGSLLKAMSPPDLHHAWCCCCDRVGTEYRPWFGGHMLLVELSAPNSFDFTQRAINGIWL